jgi:DNA-binding NarL/FixJ family response regulator
MSARAAEAESAITNIAHSRIRIRRIVLLPSFLHWVNEPPRSEAGWGAPIVVADGDPKSRAFIVALIERIGSRPYEAETGPEALALAESLQPAVVILDVALPEISGYEVCHELRDRFGDTLSLVFVSSTRGEALDRVAGLLIGADDYIVKPFDPDELLVRVRALPRRQDGHRNRHDESTEDGNSALTTLTLREREVLALLAQGRNQGEIALELVISSKTVATHIQRVLAKLGVHSRAHAVAVAYREGLLEGDVHAHALVSASLAAY